MVLFISTTVFYLPNRITSSQSNITVIKYADDTCIIGCIGKQCDLNIYFYKIKRISKQCNDLNLSLNPSKTQENMFSTHRAKPHTPTLVLNGINIVLPEKVRYLGVLVDQNLRFH